MSVRSAKKKPRTKKNALTTSTPSWIRVQDSQPGMLTFKECFPELADSRSSASPATTSKQQENETLERGVKNDSGKPRTDLLSSKAMLEIAKVMSHGATKYKANNWRGGIAWSRVIGAAFRHLMAFNDGVDKDPETGLSHIAHLACCAMFLLEYEQTHKELDDRYKGEK